MSAYLHAPVTACLPRSLTGMPTREAAMLVSAREGDGPRGIVFSKIQPASRSTIG
jgi:hypothetical protein